MDVRPRISKIKQNKNTKCTMQAINSALSEFITASADLEELCHNVYCAAAVANDIQQTKNTVLNHKNLSPQRPPWETRIEKKITTLRKEIGLLHSYLGTENPSNRVKEKIQQYARKLKLKRGEAQYHLRLRTHAENLKQKIAAMGNRLRRYNKRTQRYRQNNLFTSNQKKFFRALDDDTGKPQSAPPKLEEVERYWSDIWSQGQKHNTEAHWIKTEIEEQRNLREMAAVTVSEEDVRATINRLKNWTSPGVDGIHNYWWKSLTSTHEVLSRFIQKALENPHSVPEYFTHGITHLLPKKGDLNQPGNYRPITCLSSAYKILTSTIAFKINSHLKNNNIMAWEQNGCKRKGRGSKELLIIDNMLTKQAKKKLKNISMAWIDYQKAFDSVPHSWLIEVLKIYKVNPQVIALLQYLMSTWRTTLTVRGGTATYKTTDVEIRRGIFQGDSLSPLWFCLALNILSRMLNRSAYAYSINDQAKLTHLFYMDDLKLYARGRKQLEGLLELVRKFSEDIGMSFGLEKCATVNVKRGKMSEEENIVLSDGREVASLRTEDRYKYLGIQQTYEIRHKENKEDTKNELLRRVRKILKSHLSAKNKLMAINIWAIPPFTYTAGLLTWSKTDLEQVDRSIRTSLTRHGMLHPNSAIERLYLPRKEGGRGMTNLEAACLKEKENINKYFLKTNLPVHQWVAATASPRVTDEDVAVRENRLEKFRQAWQAKPLHGRFYASLHQVEVDLQSSNTYLTQGYLFPQTEGTFLAIQDQVVPTRTYIKHILKQQVETTKCRLCNAAEESVQHLSSGCSSIAGTKYLNRHNNMGKVVHQLLGLQKQLIQHFIPHHIYTPQTILEDEQCKVYWDLTVITDIGVEHNRPDMVLWDKQNKTATIIDFAVPLDHNLAKSYAEKISKYEALSQQMKDMWRLRRVTIMPLVISANGLVHRKTIQHLKELNLPQNTITWMQKAVILGTVNIIRKIIYPH